MRRRRRSPRRRRQQGHRFRPATAMDSTATTSKCGWSPSTTPMALASRARSCASTMPTRIASSLASTEVIDNQFGATPIQAVPRCCWRAPPSTRTSMPRLPPAWDLCRPDCTVEHAVREITSTSPRRTTSPNAQASNRSVGGARARRGHGPNVVPDKRRLWAHHNTSPPRRETVPSTSHRAHGALHPAKSAANRLTGAQAPRGTRSGVPASSTGRQTLFRV